MCATSAARRYAGSRSRPRRRRCTRTPSAGSPPFSPAMRGRAFSPPTSTRATTACTYRRSSPPPPQPPAARAARVFSNLPRAALGRDREPQRERRVRRRPPPRRPSRRRGSQTTALALPHSQVLPSSPSFHEPKLTDPRSKPPWNEMRERSVKAVARSATLPPAAELHLLLLAKNEKQKVKSACDPRTFDVTCVPITIRVSRRRARIPC